MPRKVRQRSATGIYHVVMRGNDRRMLFEDADDFNRFVSLLQAERECGGCRLFCYVLLGNHTHLLIQENQKSISSIIHDISTSYALYFHFKYKSTGHVFQGRFFSSPVEDERYFLACMHYICYNPVKAGLVSDPRMYPWFGCRGVTKERVYIPLDPLPSFITLSPDDIRRVVLTAENADLATDHAKPVDEEVAKIIIQIAGCQMAFQIANASANVRKAAILAALQAGATVRQISRITDISASAVSRISRS